MRNECSIIRDLLPLYIEEMVSADTVAFMEEHLEKCDTCRAELGGMKAQNDVEKAASDIPASSTMPLKTFRQKWQRKATLSSNWPSTTHWIGKRILPLTASMR